MKTESLGEKLTPILVEIEGCLLDAYGTPPCFPDDGIDAAAFIFVSALMDRMWVQMMAVGLDLGTATELAERAGADVRALFKKYTGVEPLSRVDKESKRN